MTKNMTRLTRLAASLAALASVASADVKINDYLTLSGYASASGVLADNSVGKDVSSLYDTAGELNFTKIALTGTYGDFGGKVSLLYTPSRVSGTDAGILDAYLDWTKSNFTVTVGKFGSFLGYESFDTSAMTQLTYAADFFAIPDYHTGANVTYAAKTWGAGVALVDSVYGKPGAAYWRSISEGDGSYSNGIGEEAYVTYTGINNLTLWLGGAEEQNNSYTIDLWASYVVNSALTLAAEVDSQEGVAKGWLTEAQYTFNPKLSAVLRVSGARYNDKSVGAGTNFTVAPTYKLTSNLSIRGEITYADSAAATAGDYGILTSRGMFYGVQALFTF